ncbi:sigma-70 family RNA polymerase sigma factor [Nocardioides sp. KC13]|uniref:Sigma-70 family RNA polymerase sigma factor n=1 Tax=Nocardioides turkmenicus TaxID=2711220 RepID=A0A6M1RA54_9ACTN|nr:sigma-70 family RNA polymerase sigma factor [Nocardioides sp. KC13]NGN94409.1 sigma-70 family RNA polymerase sigma factor [Nocardioides sp. KC13]
MTTEGPAPKVGFEETYREHRIALLRLAYLMSGSHEVSEDVVQSVFTSAHERWDQIETPLPYLKRAVVNLVKDGQRRHLRRLARPAERPPVALPQEVDETWTQIARLPWVQRAVVVLHYYEDLPLAEIADILDRPAATVRSDHRRALDKLRKALA